MGNPPPDGRWVRVQTDGYPLIADSITEARRNNVDKIDPAEGLAKTPRPSRWSRIALRGRCRKTLTSAAAASSPHNHPALVPQPLADHLRGRRRPAGGSARGSEVAGTDGEGLHTGRLPVLSPPMKEAAQASSEGKGVEGKGTNPTLVHARPGGGEEASPAPRTMGIDLGAAVEGSPGSKGVAA